MATLFKDEAGQIQMVTESKEVTLDWVENEVKEAELALQRAKDLRDQYLRTKELGNVEDVPQPEAPAPVDPQPAHTVNVNGEQVPVNADGTVIVEAPEATVTVDTTPAETVAPVQAPEIVAEAPVTVEQPPVDSPAPAQIVVQ